jgi:hypothetical protein
VDLRSEDGRLIQVTGDGQRLETVLRTMKHASKRRGNESVNHVTIAVRADSNLANVWVHYLESPNSGSVPPYPSTAVPPADRMRHIGLIQDWSSVELEMALGVISELENET